MYAHDQGQVAQQTGWAGWHVEAATWQHRSGCSWNGGGEEQEAVMWLALLSIFEQSAHCQIEDDQQRPWRHFLHFACSGL